MESPLLVATVGTPADLPYSVSTKGLTKRFGGRTVVADLDLAIPTGSVCGLIGPNGAGKTTTIRMLLGLVRPTSGGGTVLGHPLTDPSAYLASVGALIESPSCYPTLSGRANLRVLARLGGIDESMVAKVLDLVGLTDRAGDAYRTYSLGMKQRLGIAAALLPEPALLVPDPPEGRGPAPKVYGDAAYGRGEFQEHLNDHGIESGCRTQLPAPRKDGTFTKDHFVIDLDWTRSVAPPAKSLILDATLAATGSPGSAPVAGIARSGRTAPPPKTGARSALAVSKPR